MKKEEEGSGQVKDSEDFFPIQIEDPNDIFLLAFDVRFFF